VSPGASGPGAGEGTGVAAELERSRAVAAALAAEAGAILLEGWGTRPKFEFKGGDIDLVTEFDRRSEALIVSRLAAEFPTDTIIGEEGSAAGPSRQGSRGRVWFIDPLDGTTNFSHGLPLFSVSIGLTVDGVAMVGAVEAPALRWSFSGAVGAGATWNGRPIAPSAVDTIARALVVTGFPYSRQPRQDNLAEWAALVGAAQGTRRLGSAALDLSFVACGWLDAYWERALHPWDLVAGAAIVNAAGGRATELDGTPFIGDTGRVLATNGRLHQEMIEILRRVATTSGDPWP
jgi:myo-inositol-1(or 4)-monophosphatase